MFSRLPLTINVWPDPTTRTQVPEITLWVQNYSLNEHSRLIASSNCLPANYIMPESVFRYLYINIIFF